ncbi:lipopolysaccharide biosynthesis protein RfbH (plasmid) [Telmatobacter bradus]|uniref:lipopolysaccharide biosynthesis protein RfbH n=1 Tax=Telmatobacter bradus TaxID=474953 RepID=UPI003B42DF44
MSNSRKEELRAAIQQLTTEYYQEAFPAKSFVPGESHVPVSGRFFDEKDVFAVVDSGLDFWLTAGRFAELFEFKFAKFLGLRDARLVNSGSSANLVAISCLTSPTLGDRQLKPGDEVITVAAGFPTTVAPIVQNGLVPVFIDVELENYNADTSQLQAALSPRTKAIIFAHTLGNTFDVQAVAKFARANNLWLIEDCCDALGSTFEGRMVGSFGDIATFSFYPAHHITMGEGGCVATNKPQLTKLIESFRDWGRDCWCAPGKDNTCGKRFDWQLGDLPYGYDHKYTYSHMGYNLKVSDMQAAVGCSQLEKVREFIASRKKNFAALSAGLQDLQDVYLLPTATAGSDPSWFGFPIAVRPESGIERDTVIRFLNDRKIGTRLLFAGNLTKQPAFNHVKYRVIGDLKNTDYVMNNVFWVGVYPGLSEEMIEHMLNSLREVAKH